MSFNSMAKSTHKSFFFVLAVAARLQRKRLTRKEVEMSELPGIGARRECGAQRGCNVGEDLLCKLWEPASSPSPWEDSSVFSPRHEECVGAGALGILNSVIRM